MQTYQISQERCIERYEIYKRKYIRNVKLSSFIFFLDFNISTSLIFSPSSFLKANVSFREEDKCVYLSKNYSTSGRKEERIVILFINCYWWTQ